MIYVKNEINWLSTIISDWKEKFKKNTCESNIQIEINPCEIDAIEKAKYLFECIETEQKDMALKVLQRLEDRTTEERW